MGPSDDTSTDTNYIGNVPKEESELTEDEKRHFKLLSFMSRYKGYAEPVVDRTSKKSPQPPKRVHHKSLYHKLHREKIRKTKNAAQ